METATKVITVAAELKQLLLARRTTGIHRFKLDVSASEAEKTLAAAYLAEVEARGRKYIDNPEIIENVAQIAKFATSGDDYKFNLMFCGMCGNGKTTMLKALQNAIWYIIGCTGQSEFAGGLNIYDAKAIYSLGCKDGKLDEIKDSPLLAIDDLGREPSELQSYGNTLSPMVDLLEYRYDKMLFTVMTTNLKPEEISKHYGKRIADRFRETVELVFFECDSYRGNTEGVSYLEVN